MLNPMRPPMEQALFQTEADVFNMIKNMEESLAAIADMQTSEDPNKDAIILRNQQHLTNCLAFESIQTASIDLTRYVI